MRHGGAVHNTVHRIGPVSPPTVALKASIMLNGYHEAARDQFTSSFNFFIGSALTVLDAGFALKTHGSFVNGFTPFRAGVAGFDFSFKFSMPAILNDPVFFSSPAATPIMASTPM